MLGIHPGRQAGELEVANIEGVEEEVAQRMFRTLNRPPGIAAKRTPRLSAGLALTDATSNSGRPVSCTCAGIADVQSRKMAVVNAEGLVTIRFLP
jgi:hypothetical protein